VPVFFAFRIMVGIMIAARWVGLLLWLRGHLFETRWYLWLDARGWRIGFVAVICGWIVTETGRQPWIAMASCAWPTPPLRTPPSASPHRWLFVIVHAFVFDFGIYYMNRGLAISTYRTSCCRYSPSRKRQPHRRAKCSYCSGRGASAGSSQLLRPGELAVSGKPREGEGYE
jgi:cytochrome bd-type quinol oxidase subunit 1